MITRLSKKKARLPPRTLRSLKREKLKNQEKLRSSRLKSAKKPNQKKDENSTKLDSVTRPNRLIDGGEERRSISRSSNERPKHSPSNDKDEIIKSKFRRISKLRFPRRKIIVNYPFQIFMGNLIEYTQSGYSYANRGFKYILILIDIFTRKAYAEPVKKKNRFEISTALNKILETLDHYPNTLITDEGLEFYNKNVRSVLEKFVIHHYSIRTKMKASYVERLNRTLKTEIEKHFELNKTKNWIDVLQTHINAYNSSYHRSIGMAPDEVTDKNAPQVFKRLFPNFNVKRKPRLELGDKVRVLREKTIFQKGYTQKWSDEIFTISKIKQTLGIVWYRLKTSEKLKVPGIKYYWQLNKIGKNDR